MGSEEGSTMRNFIVCTVHLIVKVNKSRRLRWAGNVARMEEGRGALKLLTGKPSGKRYLGMLRCMITLTANQKVVDLSPAFSEY